MSAPAASPTDLTVEYDTAPENVRPSHPRFGWRVATGSGTAPPSPQTAYRILVARSEDTLADDVGDVWDSGRVDSGRSVHVEYGGRPLAPDRSYVWKVRIWTEDGEASEYSDTARFGTALESDRDWAGEWIAHQPDPGDSAGYRSDWQRAATATDQWVQVDLGGLVEFETVELSPANAAAVPTTPDGGAVRGQFGFPTGYRVEVSNDPGFGDARELVTRTGGDDQRGTRSYDVGPTTGRYVRVTATDQHEIDPIRPYYRKEDIEVGVDLRPWAVFALSRLAVRDDEDRDLALHQPVRAKTSADYGPWGRDKLVDGTEGIHDASTSPLLRGAVDLDKAVDKARLHVAAVGYGECYINGERVGEAVLDPAWTNYQDRVLYRTYDVTDFLEDGPNTIGLWLGRGWFTKWGRGSPRAIVELTVEYTDGTTFETGTDATWRATASPVRANDIYDGETYDAREAIDGWATPGVDTEDWDEAAVVRGPGGDLEPQEIDPIRIVETLDPEEIHDHEDGPVVDFGQNHTGWLEVNVSGMAAGDELILKHAEVLDEAGGLERTDLRSADATDRYISDGDQDIYEPRFTFHGYRYAQLEGYPGELTPDDLTAKVVHTDFESIGRFECSNEELDQVNSNARWGLRSNAHSVPTDCPQRNERLGWTGDAQLAGRALMYNFDALGFHEKWMRDHDDAQSRAGHLPPVIPPRHRLRVSDPSWTVTRVVIPWYLYCHYGDEAVLRDHYEEMCRYVEYWHGVAEAGIVPEKYGDYGDWLAFENNDGRRGKPFVLFNTAFHYRTTDLMGRIASVLGNEADARRFFERAEEIADAFNERFFDADDHRYEPHIQSAYAMPLSLGIVPAEAVDDVVATLATKVREEDDGKLQTGFLGTRALINTLVDHGEADLAYHIVSQPERPGWVYMVRQGATTMWERWDSDDRVGSGMNSYNHSPFALVSEWFYRAIAGLRFEESFGADGRVDIAPAFVSDLDWAEGSVETPYGEVASRWERTDEGIAVTVTLPWNTTGRVRVPSGALTVDGVPLREDSEDARHPAGIRSVERSEDQVLVEVAAGTHEITVAR